MSNYSQIYIHVVFAVKGRFALISPEWEERLYKFITGLVKAKSQKMLAINGMPNHIHFFIGMKPSCKLSDLIRDIKKSSTDFVNSEGFLRIKFSWQEGYSAFSYGESQVSRVINYIMSQKEHHRKRTFREEYLSFLEKFHVEYDLRNIFDLTD